MDSTKTFAASGYAIRALQLFENVDAASIAPLLADCEVMRLPSGQAVPGGGGGNNACLYIVLSGALSGTAGASAAGTPNGSSIKFLPGECIGELAVLEAESHLGAVVALEDSDVLLIKADRLWKLIDKSNGVARNMLHLLSFRVRAANAQTRRRQKLGEFYRQMSMVDGLTSLQNRAWLDDQLPLLVGHAHAGGQALSIIMIDLDHFKQFNDNFGHQLGDHALQVAAKVLSAALRPTDFAVRYGGEELMVILPQAPLTGGLTVARRICERMREAVVFTDMRTPLPHITASFGVASLAPQQDSAALVGAADAAMYRAKHAGRDRVAD